MEESNEQLYIKSRKKINNCNARAGGLTGLRCRLDMEDSNAHFDTNTFDKGQVVTYNIIVSNPRYFNGSCIQSAELDARPLWNCFGD
ncbi:MAG: hypothetical protein P0116_11950 [Candidatus Nitrosocosmicus sp.]|nr:hypothetical protein [Candidatus Nitrosocosmicus sp.]